MRTLNWFDRNSTSYPTCARVLALLVALFVAFLFWFMKSDWAGYWVLKDGRPITAMVTGHLPHGAVAYSYTVNEEGYSGESEEGYRGSRDVGDPIQVYYSESHPRLSLSKMLSKTTIGWVAAVTILLFSFCEILAVRTILNPRGKWTIDFSRIPMRYGAQAGVLNPAHTRLSAVVMALLLLGLLAYFGWSGWTDYWLLTDGRPITATVIGRDSRGSVSYIYTVDGEDYTGTSIGYLLFASDSDEIPVYYSSSHLSLSSPSMPSKSGMIFRGVGITLLILLLEVLAVRMIINPKRNWTINFRRRAKSRS